MPVTKLDPKTALVIVDLQKGIVALPTAQPTDVVVARSAKLADAFRSHGLPIVFVTVAGGAPGRTEQAPRSGDFPAEWVELVPELNRQPQDHMVVKRTWGAFTKTDLDTHLRGLGVTQIVLTGVATSIGVESTARYAHENGFNVTLAVDAMADLDADSHVNSVTRIFPRLGETGTTQDILELLEKTRT
jgi:nicotinamidase-related amidase